MANSNETILYTEKFKINRREYKAELVRITNCLQEKTKYQGQVFAKNVVWDLCNVEEFQETDVIYITADFLCFVAKAKCHILIHQGYDTSIENMFKGLSGK